MFSLIDTLKLVRETSTAEHRKLFDEVIKEIERLEIIESSAVVLATEVLSRTSVIQLANARVILNRAGKPIPPSNNG